MAKPLSAESWAGGRSISDPRISPDGTLISFIASYAHGAELVVVPVAGGAEQWLPLGARIAKGAGTHGWLPNGADIAYVGTDNCVHIFDRTTLATRKITSEVADLSALAISPDGTKVACVDDMRDLYVANTDGTGARLRLSADADFVFDPAWSTDSRTVAWCEWDVPNMPWDGARIVVRDCEAKEPIKTVAGGDNISAQQPRFSPDGKYLSFISDEFGWANISVVALPNYGRPRALIQESFEHAEPSWGPGQRSYAWSDNGESIIICRNEGGFGRLVTFDTKSRSEIVAPHQDFYSSLDTRGEIVIGMRSGALTTNHLELIAPGAARVLANTAYAGLEQAGVVPEQVKWQSTDDVTVHGRLYRSPTAKDDTPLLVWIHGGPNSLSPATLYLRWSYFLQRGWSVLVVDYRGSTGWGREYAQALRGRWGDVDVSDVVSGIEAAVANEWGSADKIVLHGASAGGFTALLAMAERPELCAAGVVMYPVTDPIAAATDSWRFEAHYTDTLIGPLPEYRDVYLERSPVERAGQIKCPVLVLHGDGDIVVPVSQSKDLVERIEKAGGTVEFHIYEGENHGWRLPGTRVDELVRMETFLNRYVLESTKGSE